MFEGRSRRALSRTDLELMNLPVRYWPENDRGNGVTFSRVQEGRHKETVRNYIRRIGQMVDSGYGVMLYGPFGTGKTAIAALICHEARRIDATVYFIRSVELKESVLNKRKWDEYSSIDERAATF